MISLGKITELAHHTVCSIIGEGDRVVDATAGNGHDTIFLAEAVGPSGQVYAFEIQKDALLKTAERLKQKNLDKRVTMIHSGHERLFNYISYPVSIIMYNLGYLPGGDRQITTKYDTTLESLKQALTLLKVGGIITIVFYPGHEQGADEKKHLLSFCRNLNASEYAVLHKVLLNQGNNPPELMVVQKKLFCSDLSG